MLPNRYAKTRAVTEAIASKDFEKAMALRDPEFKESLEGFYAVSAIEEGKKLPEDQVSLRLSLCVHGH